MAIDVPRPVLWLLSMVKIWVDAEQSSLIQWTTLDGYLLLYLIWIEKILESHDFENIKKSLRINQN